MRDRRRFQSKIAFFSYPCILHPSWSGSPWNWVPPVGAKKLKLWDYQAEKEVWRHLYYLLTCKTSPLPECVTTSNLAVLRQCVYTLVEENPTNWGALGPRHLEVSVADDLKTSPSQYVLPCQICGSALKGARINRKEPQIGRGWPLGIRSSPTCYRTEFGRSTSSSTSAIKEIRLKIWPLASRLSRSLKVIIADTDRCATYDFLVTFRSNRGPISYRFWVKRRFQSKIANFYHHRVFCAPAWNWVSALVNKSRMMMLQSWWRSLKIYLQPFGYNTRTWLTDRQTDRQTDG